MEKSGFFNSSGGDRVYSATDFAAYFGKLVSNGIFYALPPTCRSRQAAGWRSCCGGQRVDQRVLV